MRDWWILVIFLGIVSESSLDLLNWWYLQDVQRIDIQAVNFRKEVWTGDSYLGAISIKITIKMLLSLY